MRLVSRQKNLVAQAFLLPTALLLLVAFIFGGGGDAWPVLVVDEARDHHSAHLVDSMTGLQSEITPYFHLMEVGPNEGRAVLAAGRAHMLVRIPSDFGSNRTLHVETFNINSDATKNVRLRLDYALNVFERQLGLPGVVAVLETERPYGVWRSAYIGGSSVLLALFLAAGLIAANLFVFDIEHRTRTEMVATPMGLWTAGFGIVFSAIVVAIVASFVPLITSWALFGLTVGPGALTAVYLGMLPILLGCAGGGVLVGQLLRSYRGVQPIIVLVAIITFFGAGGFVGTAMLPPAIQAFAVAWIPSRIFAWFNPVLHGFVPGLSITQIGWSLLAAAAGLAATVYGARRELRLPPAASQ